MLLVVFVVSFAISHFTAGSAILTGMNGREPKRRWYRPAPAWLVYASLAITGLLFLSERWRWFWFNERKGWTVLVAVAGLGMALLLMTLWFVVALLFRCRFQFSIRSLLVLVVAVALPCSWLAVEIKEAKRQQNDVAALASLNADVLFDEDLQDYDDNKSWFFSWMGVWRMQTGRNWYMVIPLTPPPPTSSIRAWRTIRGQSWNWRSDSIRKRSVERICSSFGGRRDFFVRVARTAAVGLRREAGSSATVVVTKRRPLRERSFRTRISPCGCGFGPFGT